MILVVQLPHRILYFYPYTHAHTGSPRMLLNLIGALDRSRFTPVFLAVGEGGLVDEMRARDVEVVSGSAGACSLRAPVDLAARTLKLAGRLKAWRIDLVHVNEFAWNLDLGFAAWLRRIPLVLHSHNPATVGRGNLMRFAADRILFVSQGEMTATEGFDLIRDKSRVLYNFIDFDYYGSGSNVRAALGLPEDAFVVATVAQISARKGIDTLIATARACVDRDRDIRFLVIGGDAVNEDDFADRMRDEATALGLGDHVRFLGARNDVPDLLASADVLFHPARREPFGLVIVEAMAAGKPVVAAAVGGIPEIMAAVGTGTPVENATAESFADAILRLRAQPDRGASIGAAAREQARRKFSREALIPQLQQTYDELIGGQPSRSTG